MNILTTLQHNNVPVDYSLKLGATLRQVLEVAGLLDAYAKSADLLLLAERQFSQGNPRAATGILHNIWLDSEMVSALLLAQCYKARELIFPDWGENSNYSLQQLAKKTGGTRPIIVPTKQTRICMGMVNTLLQTGCNSWSNRSTGFRPNNGTLTALTLLQKQAMDCVLQHGRIVILSFDITKAFNSVSVADVFNTLQLHTLPSGIKRLIWKWQHTPVLGGLDPAAAGSISLLKGQAAPITGLAQGFSYSPTLFAWYLDSLLVKQTSLIGYADNFAGAFSSYAEARVAFEKASALLQNAGLFVNADSVMYDSAFIALDNSLEFPWLGHDLFLPTCDLRLNVNLKKSTVSADSPTFISLKAWENQLLSTHWVNTVRLSHKRQLFSLQSSPSKG